MKISLPDDSHIDHLKITEYLLNIDHKDGRAKARAFREAGFDPAEPDRLALALLEHATKKLPRSVEGRYGVRFVFEGPLNAPGGTMSHVRSVWLVKSGETCARLVTAYPFDERR